MMGGELRLRPVNGQDMPLLLRMYASTRAAEMAMLPWDDAAKDAFVRMQFNAQHQHYQQHYQGARFDVVQTAPVSGPDTGMEAVGRLYTWRRAGSVHIVDITILPEFRQRGFGTRLLRALMDEARAAGAAVSIHVEHGNPALALYLRLGFRKVSAKGMHDLMEWRAAGPEHTIGE